MVDQGGATERGNPPEPGETSLRGTSPVPPLPREKGGTSEAARRGPDAAFVSVAENSPDIVTLLDRDLRIIYTNRVEEPHRLEEVIGATILDLIPPSYAESVTDTFEIVARTREPGWYQTENHDSRGITSYWTTVVGAVVEHGDVVGFSMIARDISEERRERAAQDRFFHLSIDMLCVAGFDQHFKRVNPSFCRILGFDPDELLTRPILSFVLEEDHEKTIEAFRALFQGEAVIDFENRYVRKDGAVRWISWRATSDPKRDEIYAVARDVTDRKQLEAQLRQSHRLEAVGQLAGGIAHDFNNLLHAIQSNVHFARSLAGDASRRDEALDRIEGATRRTAGLVRQLLSFSEMRPPRRVMFNFEKQVREVLDLVGSLLPGTISRTLSVDPDLPTEFYGDPSQLEQIVMNLCINARDAIPDGGEIGVVLERSPESSGGRDWLRISVRDNGMGMTPEVRERVFEPFFTTKEPGKGTGLGLSTVYGIVRQHEGRISVESAPGEGTTFIIDLPVRGSDPAAEPITRDTGERLHGHETILVAEDEELVRGVLERILETAGYQLVFANDGREALELFEQRRAEIDLVILDHVMPGRTGVEVLEAIRLAGSTVPVLISSGFRKHGQPTGDGTRTEPDGFLEKPFQPPELLAEVRRLLGA